MQAANIDSNWKYVKAVTIDDANVEDDPTDFPVLVSVTDADLSAKAQADADDIVYTPDGEVAMLDCEIEHYESATGALRAWVRVPISYHLPRTRC